jgi:hypothetical protein
VIGLTSTCSLRRSARRVHLGEDSPGVLEEDLARAGESDDALQMEDGLAQWRLGHVQAPGGATEVELFRDGHEIPEMTKLHGLAYPAPRILSIVKRKFSTPDDSDQKPNSPHYGWLHAA